MASAAPDAGRRGAATREPGPVTLNRERAIAIAIVLASIAGTATFLAQGTMQLVGSAVLPLDPGFQASAGAQLPSPGATPPRRRGRRDPIPILQRNIFDHELGDLTRPPEEPEEVAEVVEEEETPTGEVPYCEGSMRLAGTMVHPTQPELSLANITDSPGSSLLYRLSEGENLVDGRPIVGIYPFAVHLLPDDGQRCRLAMFDEEAPTTATVARRSRSSSDDDDDDRRRRGRDDEDDDDDNEYAQGITKVSDTQYRVDRSLVDRLLANQAQLMRAARIIPHSEGGRVVGVKLYGIRRNSLFNRLGIQNGDMLRTINGFDMTSPDKALEAYSRLRTADNLSVNVVRRGEAMTLDYNIQ